MAELPTGSDLQAWMTSIGIYDASFSALLDDAISAAIDMAEDFTWCKPLVAASGDTHSVRRHNPPGTITATTARTYGEKFLILSAPARSITEIRVRTETDGTDGDVLTEWTDYKIVPTEWQTSKGWFRSVEIYLPVKGLPGSIAVDAAWGAHAFNSVPSKLRTAILRLATYSLSDQVVMFASHGGLSGWDDGDVSEKYASPQDWLIGTEDKPGLLTSMKKIAYAALDEYRSPEIL